MIYSKFYDYTRKLSGLICLNCKVRSHSFGAVAEAAFDFFHYLRVDANEIALCHPELVSGPSRTCFGTENKFSMTHSEFSTII